MQWKRLREAYKDFSIGFEPNVMLTLATNQSGNIEKMRKLVKGFSARMDRWALGHIWHNAPINERANGIFYMEHINANIHAHGLVRFPYANSWGRSLMAVQVWNKLCPSGSVDLRPVTYAAGAADYLTKEMKWDRYNEDQIILLADFMSEKSRLSLTD